ncbi:MAG: rhodanese-like domain-containing protein [Sulfurovum sp.]|nr:MAG: rhodanese-like domain-containing protein [Sulfurovum sp.]
MIKIALIFFMTFSILSSNDISLQFSGVKTNYINAKGETKQITIEREIDPKCMDIHISNDVFWKAKYASNKVPKACKSTFITSAGKVIFPMQIHKEIETYGEMEVMAFIKKMQHDSTMLFIDTRDEEWYEYRTIPGAMNIHYVYMMKPKVFEEEYKKSLVKLGILGKKKPFDFSQAKTILLFCNGAWCSQSPKMVKALLALGYPPEKIKWYRGGMDDWLGLSMTTTKK